jgi:hypothetical protein
MFFFFFLFFCKNEWTQDQAKPQTELRSPSPGTDPEPVNLLNHDIISSGCDSLALRPLCMDILKLSDLREKAVASMDEVL